MHPVANKALLVGNGRVPPRACLEPGVLDGVGLVIAADAGAAACRQLGLRPDVVVGDLDSADPAEIDALERAGVTVLRVPAEKDESDLELALRVAVERGVRRAVALAVLGGLRVEHELSAIALLGLAADLGVDLRLVDDRSAMWLLDPGAGAGEVGRSELAGAPGDYVSLFPFGGGAEGVTTNGLRYPLRDEALPAGPSRGLSNELVEGAAWVSCRRGRVLIVHTRRAAVDGGRGSCTGEDGPGMERSEPA